MANYADLKAKTIYLTDSLSLYDGTNRATLTTTTLFGTNLIISNANLSGTATSVTVDVSDNSSKLSTTAFVKSQQYATTTMLSSETTRATTAEALCATKTYVDSTFVSLSGSNTLSGTNYINSKTYFGLNGAYGNNAVLNVRAGYYGSEGISIMPTSNYSNLIVFYNSANNVRAQIVGTGGSVAYQTSSDRRLKTNIQTMSPMMDKIMALKPSEYNWLADNQKGFGFIAQEVHAVFPELRTVQENGSLNTDEPTNIETGEPIYYGLDYGLFTPYMVKAIQEIKLDYEDKISKLEQRLAYLENK